MKSRFISFLFSIGMLQGALSSHAQSPADAFLSKYSYPIFVVKGNRQFTGTAFFYQSGDTAFLVSNYHAIKGMNPMKRMINFTSDTLYLEYRVKESGDRKLMLIATGNDITGETELFSMVDRIDLLKVPVSIPADADIKYINELVEEEYFHAIPEEVIVYGHPAGNGSIPAFYSKQQCLRGNMNPMGFADYDASLKIDFPRVSDSARTILAATSRYYYFIKPYAAQGYSGAPVFGKFRRPDRSIVYRFTGVVFAGQPATHQTWAIRGDVAWQYMLGG